jgi:two-component system C4-dicarboxylate transport sensor histidine kinase DctB
MGAIKGRHAIFVVLALVVVAVVAAGGWQLAYLRLMGEQERQLLDRLTVSQRSVESEIERFRYLPDVVGQDERIARLLRKQDASAAVAAANAYLQAVRGMSGADELYVLDLDGNTLATSNWNEPGSFLGHNYAFRPYFRDALAQGSGRFYAVGVTTGKPGYFLSSRIEAGGRVLGVAVAKVDMSPLAATWAQAGELSGLADSDGVVFLSGEPRWTYRPLRPLGGTSLARIAEERRYDGIDLSQAIPLGLPVDREGSVRLTFDDLPYIVDARSIEPDGWQLVSALPLQPVEREARLTGGIAGLVALMLFALVALWRQRRQITRLKLEQAGVLELRVAERTQALAHEVEERRRAEAELRATQESLVHAAKLAALGQMSAAIVHEVSQPLSALDNTLAAADLHAQREATGQVRRNLGAARDLLRRMQRTVKHLRSFSSRRDPGPPE